MKPYVIKIRWTHSARAAASCFLNRKHLFLLETSMEHDETGRYSFIGFDPYETCIGKGKKSLQKLKDAWEKYAGLTEDCGLPLQSGAVGYLAYDFGLYHEPVKLRSENDIQLPVCCFGLYDLIIVIDHHTGHLHIVSSGLPESGTKKRAQKAERRAVEVRRILKEFTSVSEKPIVNTQSHNSVKEGRSNFTRRKYISTVKKALDYIAKGEIYQVNLSQRFTWDLPSKDISPFDVYNVLSDLSPTPFGCFFDAGDHAVISNSPERFLKITGKNIETRPMKGTRPRGITRSSDKRMRTEIEKSRKDIAELLMITDLERNDLGRVCEFGSVKVKHLRDIEEYSTVYQATSTVVGKLTPENGAFEALSACFPGGSITGCPKIRAMEIIEELEPCRRGIYTGSFGYIDFNGNADFNILIRTLLYKGEKMFFQTGGGIVADSDPEEEYEETLTKAEAMRQCLKVLAHDRSSRSQGASV